MPQEPALLTSEGMDAEAQSASSERRPGWPKRASGDGAWAALNREPQKLSRETSTGTISP